MLTQSDVQPGQIVQIVPDAANWAACLVIVTEVRAWGIQGFAPMPPDGRQAYIRANFEDLEPTGGVAPFVPEDAFDTED
jgi:hypothetical protein